MWYQLLFREGLHMGVSNRVNAGRTVLDAIRPEWFKRVRVNELTFKEKGSNHLLSQIFGSFEHGETAITMSSTLSLVKLGFLPGALEGTAAHKGETASMLERWKGIILALQERDVLTT